MAVGVCMGLRCLSISGRLRFKVFFFFGGGHVRQGVAFLWVSKFSILYSFKVYCIPSKLA